jgi:hypothetical protein
MGKAMEEIEIRVKSQLDKEWSMWLEGLSIIHTDNGDTALTGEVRDQAAMYGLLDKLYSMGVRLLSVSCENKPVKIKEGKSM